MGSPLTSLPLCACLPCHFVCFREQLSIESPCCALKFPCRIPQSFFRNPVFPTLFFLPHPPSLTSLLLLPFHSSVDSELTSLCQSVLEDFNLCLFYLPSSPNLSLASEDEEEYESGYAFLPDLLIFQMVVICLMGVHSLKRAGNFLGPSSPPLASGILTTLFCSFFFINFLPQAAL